MIPSSDVSLAACIVGAVAVLLAATTIALWCRPRPLLVHPDLGLPEGTTIDPDDPACARVVIELDDVENTGAVVIVPLDLVRAVGWPTVYALALDVYDSREATP